MTNSQSPDRAALADELAANIIDAAFISPPKSYKLKSGNRELMITILSDKLAEHLAALRPLSPYSGAAGEQLAKIVSMWPHSIYTEYHLDNWTAADFAKHTEATIKTVRWLVALQKELHQILANPTTLPRDAERDDPFRKLVNELEGFISIYSVNMREAAGNTNLAVLKHHLEAARAALSPSPTSVMPDEGKQK